MFTSPKPLLICLVLMLTLAAAMVMGLSVGSAGISFKTVWTSFFTPTVDATHQAIILQIRLPRVLLAALVGATLSLGGLVFQALLKNPLAEPYILGISGGAAMGAIIGILMGLSRIPGVGITAFIGSLATLFLILSISSGSALLIRDTLLLSGVMVNAFCSAVIMFLLSMAPDSRLHTIIFWLMGDLSASPLSHVGLTAAFLLPCFGVIFICSHQMNLLLLGSDMAASMGVSVRKITVLLLGVTSLMVSITVSQCGLIGFVGLVVPHLFRLVVGPDHRILVPCCIFGGGAYMVVCDLLARWLPAQGEMPDGVITAMIGAPLFILLLRRLKK